MDQIINVLRKVLGDELVVSGASLRERATSYWDASPTQSSVMVCPRSTADLSKTLEICHNFNQALVTQGGLTGCVEGAVSLPSEIIVSLEKMAEIEEIDELGGTVTVYAGVTLQRLQEALAEKQMLFPLDLGARGSCTIGGNVATNAGGINVLRYGMMRNLVLGLEVVLADGTVLSSMNHMLKNNAGYDLKQLFIGSEGTLGIVSRAVLRTYPKMPSRNTALLALDSFENVLSLLKLAQREFAGTLSAYEVMWGEYYDDLTVDGAHRAPMARNYPFYVIIELEGACQTRDSEMFQGVLERAFTNEVIVDAVITKSESEREEVWSIRENFELLLAGQAIYLYDVSLPIKNMSAYVGDLRQVLKDRWPEYTCYVFGHIADGNLHLFIRPADEGSSHADVNHIVYGALGPYQGSVSAEHGIGVEKKPWLAHSRTEQELHLMRTLKETMDPKNILNPGRVIDI